MYVSTGSGFQTTLYIDLRKAVQHNTDNITHFEADGYPSVFHARETVHPYLDALDRA